MDILPFHEVYASDLCPTAGAAGTRFARPSGDAALARRVCRQWPGEAAALGDIVGRSREARKDASRWLASTEFGSARSMRSPEPTLPHAIRGVWTRTGGAAEVAGTALFAFDVDWAYATVYAGVTEWTLVVLDTHSDPPDAYRAAGLLAQAGYIAGAFHHLTGEASSVLLVAPGYEDEHRLSIPAQDWTAWAHLHLAQRGLRRVRPHLHCYERTGAGRDAKWRCPLRQARRCGPHSPLPSKGEG